MKLLKAAIIICLLLNVNCKEDNSPNTIDVTTFVTSINEGHVTSDTVSVTESSESSSVTLGNTTVSVSVTESSESSSVTLGNTTVSDIAETSVSDVSSTKEDETTNKQIIDTDNDIIITGNISPEEITTDPGVIGDSSSSSTVTDSTTDSILSTTLREDITESKEDACSSSPCRNGGTCVDDSSILPQFSCICPSGYVGIRCGTKDECKINDGILCKSGACIYSYDGLVRSCECLQGMYWDDEKRECLEPALPCFPNPCQNGGSCTEDNDTFTCDCISSYEGKNCSIHNKCGNCTDGICMRLTIFDGPNVMKTIKYCKCKEGFYWNEESSICEIITLPCIPNPCKNGGACNVLSEKDFNCTCSNGFSGKTCEVVDKCSTDEDCKHGSCLLSKERDFRTCECDKGYYLEEEAHVCREINKPCEPNPCSNDGVCTAVSANAFNCTCSEGYKGSTCSLRDKCKMDWGKVYCGDAECNNNYDLGIYYCSCKEDEYFSYSQRKCLAVDLCPLMQCDSTEKCIQGECRCNENYKWDNETGKCKPDFCSSNPCPSPDMVCEEGSGSTTYKCSCQDGYAFNGKHCSKAFCIFPNFNDCEQICTETDDGYQCQCEEGFSLKDDNRTCAYLGNSTCTNKTCEKGSCIVKDEMEKCICPPGHTEVGGKCVDLCSTSESSVIKAFCPSDECESTSQAGFRCKCEGKYSFAKDRTTCMVRNMCEDGEIGQKACAKRNGECVQNWRAANGYDCSCREGQIVVEKTCTDICRLETNEMHCAIKGAYCVYNGNWNIFCKCPPYFRTDEDGACNMAADASYLITLPLDQATYQVGSSKRRSIDPSIDYRKVLKDVSSMAKEMFEGFTQANVLACRSSFDVIDCKIEMQFKTVQEEDLKRLQNKEACIDKDNGNRCLLPPSLVLVKDKMDKHIDFKLTDPCDEDIKEDTCGSETTCSSLPELKSFNCSCKGGFTTRRKIYPFGDTKSFIEICKDINECAGNHPCPVNSNCINTIGSFLCSCKSGYRRVKDSSDPKGEKCIEVCSPNPCTHGQCSASGAHEFDCKCDAGYGGTLCNLQDENFKGARANTVIVGAVLGGILLLTLILFIACVSRLKKKKYIEDPSHMLYNSAEMTERRPVDGAVNNAFQRG